MFAKFSVRKPLTIVIAVILIVILGGISFTKMTTDLLPSMDLPYVAVINDLSRRQPRKGGNRRHQALEQALATTSGVEAITSVSSENSSMVLLQFSEDTNMDSAMIEMSGNIDMVEGYFDDTVSAPILMKINPDLLPVMVASLDMDGKSLEELSKLVSDEVLPSFERIEGVASVTTMGLLERQLTITLNQEKIDALNDRILQAVDGGTGRCGGGSSLKGKPNWLLPGKSMKRLARSRHSSWPDSSAALTPGPGTAAGGVGCCPPKPSLRSRGKYPELEAKHQELPGSHRPDDSCRSAAH